MADVDPVLAVQVGIRIRRARMARGLTQRDLAHRMGMWASSYISEVERGVRGMTVAALARVARALTMDMRDLLPDSDSPEQRTHVDS